MEVKISYDRPIEKDKWNELCLQNNNFVQSTFFAISFDFYMQKAVYFQVYNQDKLIAGVLFSFWESKKLGNITSSISRKLSQFGEIVYNKEFDYKEIISTLSVHLTDYLKQNKIVSYSTGNLYGNTELLVKPMNLTPISSTPFNVGYVDLKGSQDELLKSFNRNTKRNIRSANENNLTFQIIDDIERFLNIEKAVYDKQPGITGPNFDYIRYLFRKMEQPNIVIATCSLNNEDLAGGFFYIFGKTAFSVFGGAKHNNVGAGHYFYFEFMKHLQGLGVEVFYFGQIAIEKDENTKFSIGISNFKRGFKCTEIPSEKNIYILKPVKYKLWNKLLNIFQWMTKK